MSARQYEEVVRRMKRSKYFRETMRPLKCRGRGDEYCSYELPPDAKGFHHHQLRWLAKRVRVGNLILEYPDFIKPWGWRNEWDHKFWYPKRGLLRHVLSKRVCYRLHVLIEKPLIKLRNGYNYSKRPLPVKRPVYHIVGFFLGLNCGFGMKACVQYTYWMLRYGGRPLAVKTVRQLIEEKELEMKQSE